MQSVKVRRFLYGGRNRWHSSQSFSAHPCVCPLLGVQWQQRMPCWHARCHGSRCPARCRDLPACPFALDILTGLPASCRQQQPKQRLPSPGRTIFFVARRFGVISAFLAHNGSTLQPVRVGTGRNSGPQLELQTPLRPAATRESPEGQETATGSVIAMAGPLPLPAAPTRPDPDPAAPPLHRRLEMGACAFFALMQSAVWLRSAGSLTAMEHAQTALIVAYYSTWLGLAALTSDAWWRRHRTAVAASRVLLFLLPSTRSLTVGGSRPGVCWERPACTPGKPACHALAPLLRHLASLALPLLPPL